MLNRRQFLTGTAALAAASVACPGSGPSFARPLGTTPPLPQGRTVPLELIAAERPGALPCFAGRTLPMWTFAEGSWPPVVRLRLGDRLATRFVNGLTRAGEHASIHWHGIRLPNAQDGVPYLVQDPVPPGGTHDYSFVPPDTGTFFFHSHCNTVETIGRGLLGILIVEGDTTEPYDADRILLLRDWRIDPEDGTFLPFFTLKGAGRAGSYGPVRSCNGASDPEIALPARGDCRLRILNVDPTRIMHVGIEGAEAAVVAVDGIAVPPFPLDVWLLGPAMRIDVVVRAPAEGVTARVLDHLPAEPVSLARLTGTGPARRRNGFDPAPLRAGRIPEPDLTGAARLRFAFTAASADQPALVEAAGGAPLGVLCTATRDFWTINQHSWPVGDRASLPPPLATLQLGRSYILELENRTEHGHPIHIHGHSFKVLAHTAQSLPVHHADTVLLLPKETATVAFVADNPGDWMLHCHIIEHQETGMMGYLRIA